MVGVANDVEERAPQYNSQEEGAMLMAAASAEWSRYHVIRRTALTVGCVLSAWAVYLTSHHTRLNQVGGDWCSLLVVPVLVWLSGETRVVLVTGLATGVLAGTFPLAWVYLGITPISAGNTIIMAMAAVAVNMVLVAVAGAFVSTRRRRECRSLPSSADT